MFLLCSIFVSVISRDIHVLNCGDKEICNGDKGQLTCWDCPATVWMLLESRELTFINLDSVLEINPSISFRALALEKK